MFRSNLKSWLSLLASKVKNPTRRAAGRPTFRPRVDDLESRLVPSGVCQTVSFCAPPISQCGPWAIGYGQGWGPQYNGCGQQSNCCSTTIAGVVYNDPADTGKYQTADAGLSGVTVTLTGTDEFHNAVDRTFITAAGGAYSFVDVLPGTYTITYTAATGFGAEKTNDALPAGATASATATLGTIANIVITSSECGPQGNVCGQPIYICGKPGIGCGQQFNVCGQKGNECQVTLNLPEVKNVTIGGIVYDDLNMDGKLETGEPGLTPPVTVTLTGTNIDGNSVSVSETTAAGGAYSFAGLLPGTYTVTYTAATGFTPEQSTQPPAGATASATATLGTIAGIVTTSGENLTVNLPETAAAAATGASLSGFVFAGSSVAGATPLAGVTLTLTGTTSTNQSVTMTTTTGANGSFTFTNLLPGSYTITQTPPPNPSSGLSVTTTAKVGTVNTVSDGTVGSSQNVITSINVAAGNTGVNYDFTDVYNSF